jgi:hypothetical protein
MEVYSHFPIRLLAWCLIKHRDNFTFTLLYKRLHVHTVTTAHKTPRLQLRSQVNISTCLENNYSMVRDAFSWTQQKCERYSAHKDAYLRYSTSSHCVHLHVTTFKYVLWEKETHTGFRGKAAHVSYHGTMVVNKWRWYHMHKWTIKNEVEGRCRGLFKLEFPNSQEQ